MAYVYAYLVEKGLRTIESVPIYLKKQVELILEQMKNLEAQVQETSPETTTE